MIWGFVLLVEIDDGNRIENEFLVVERRKRTINYKAEGNLMMFEMKHNEPQE